MRSVFALPLVIALPAVVGAQPSLSPSSSPPSPLPFAVGERFAYRVSVARLGTIGNGAMWIEGPVNVRGISTYLLRFDFQASRGPIKAVDRTSSWFDPARLASQRYSKHEKHILARRDEAVEIFPLEKRWTSNTGDTGESPTDTPLDELSFMYFIRTLPLADGESHRFSRHFDPARSPTSVTVVRREVIETPAGRFRTVLVEMRVKDPRRYKGEGAIRINLSDDSARIPVRIESTMPVVGKAVMTLDRYTTATGATIAKL
jgi:hypothetical protein